MTIGKSIFKISIYKM